MNLTTATPVEIDTKLADLYDASFALRAAERSAMTAIHRGLGERLAVSGRGHYRVESWPTSDADALAAMRAKGDELIGMMRPASALVEKYDEAAAAVQANLAEQAPLNAEYERRGRWTRFYSVAGGHIHRWQDCSTLHRGKERTRLGWLVEMSGTDEKEAIAELAAAAHVLCSVCIPDAPVASAPAAPRKTAAERAAEREAAERRARIEDEKLIADLDGEPLRVDGNLLRTVRSAEIKAVDALWWSAHSLHNHGKLREAYEGHAAKIAAALARKRGTTPAAELAALVVKATKKVSNDFGAEVAKLAAAAWAQQAAEVATAAAPAEQGGDQGGDQGAGEACPADAPEAARPFAPFDRITHPSEPGRVWIVEKVTDAATARVIVHAEDNPAATRRFWAEKCQHAPAEQAGDTAAAMTAAGFPMRTAADADPLDFSGAAVASRPVPAPHRALSDPFADTLSLRLALAHAGQVVREVSEPRMVELSRMLERVTPAPADRPLDPFLAATVVHMIDDCGCWIDFKGIDCPAHPGFRSRELALAAIAHAITPQAPAGEDAERLPDVPTMRAELARGGVSYPMADGEVPAAYRAIVLGIASEDAELDAAAGDDDTVAEVLAIADAAPTVQVTDPAGLLALVQQYGDARAEDAPCRCYGSESPEEAAGILAKIARALGLEDAAGSVAVPRPRPAG